MWKKQQLEAVLTRLDARPDSEALQMRSAEVRRELEQLCTAQKLWEGK